VIRTAAALSLVVLVAGTAAGLTPGGGPPTTDCLTEFGGTPANVPAAKPRTIRCEDNDPACDDDPTAGVCHFRIQICLNVPDPALPGCAPAALEDYVVENEQPDTNPRHDFDFQNLEDELNVLTLPLEATDVNICSGEVGMDVYLPVRLSPGRARWRRGLKILRTTVTGPGGVRDEDRLRLVCTVPRGASACDGITSTFEQIQRHLFTPTSCGRSTCHNVDQEPHELSLAPGEAYAHLVGVPPTNGVASAAGKLRVDPGAPGNSFLLDKLRGTLAPGEGVQMPFGLTPLRATEVQLVEEWILAGAPAAGFVAASGCQ
jgi:hypothetical protein